MEFYQTSLELDQFWLSSIEAMPLYFLGLPEYSFAVAEIGNVILTSSA
jgi:hypothetical protein